MTQQIENTPVNHSDWLALIAADVRLTPFDWIVATELLDTGRVSPDGGASVAALINAGYLSEVVRIDRRVIGSPKASVTESLLVLIMPPL